MRASVDRWQKWSMMVFIIAVIPACSGVYYNTLETFGVEKRDILVDRVKQARGSQQDAQEQFQSALDQFRAVVEVDGGELEKQYDKLSQRYERTSRQADEVRERIAAVDKVGKDLFAEWRGELKDYENADLRRRSEAQLEDTRERFDELMRVMQRAESRLDPVLELFEDQVLFLKHNLNARAIASLDVERVRIEERVARLLEEMQLAIREADAFIADMS